MPGVRFIASGKVDVEPFITGRIKPDEIAEKGYDDKMGARPLGRVIQEHIKKPLAEELLFGRLTKGGVVRVGVKDEAIVLEVEEPGKPRLTGSKPRLLPAGCDGRPVRRCGYRHWQCPAGP